MSSVLVEELHERIRLELKRLGLSLAAASRAIGEEDNMQNLKDVVNGRKRCPAEFVGKLAGIGVDAVYVLTGQRQVNAYCSGSSESLKVSEVCAQSMNESYREGFSQEERILLENFRSLSEEDRRAIRRQSDVFAELNRMKSEQQDKKVS